jgi:hypothetical protein
MCECSRRRQSVALLIPTILSLEQGDGQPLVYIIDAAVSNSNEIRTGGFHEMLMVLLISLTFPITSSASMWVILRSLMRIFPLTITSFTSPPLAA